MGPKGDQVAVLIFARGLFRKGDKKLWWGRFQFHPQMIRNLFSGQRGQSSGGGLGFFPALGWGDGEGDPGAQGGGGVLDLADARGVAGVE